MTLAPKTGALASKVAKALPSAGLTIENDAVIVPAVSLLEVAQHLKTAPEFDFNYLVNLTAADYDDYLEVVYLLRSLSHGHNLTLKTRCYDREKSTVPSLIGLWQGADLQEREVFDLMGITFAGHPSLKRLFLWEGFDGHPLRRDYL